jgi:hypothetical protein
MALETSAIIASVSVVVSGALGLVSVWLAFRKRTDEDSLARATRRTTALQLLSDEEFALIRVRDECTLVQNLIAAGREKLGVDFDHFASEAKRIVGEADGLLRQVRGKRKTVEPQIRTMRAAEIETVIAGAYHGKRLAEAQLQRTLLTKTDLLRSYGL